MKFPDPSAPQFHAPLRFDPIGVVRSPFREKVEAPRQPAAARGVPGTIELYPHAGFEHAVEDLAGWGYLWVIFVFDRNEGWRPKVLPPRSSGVRRGVFSTRSPHRPNPIGLSVVRLRGVRGLVLDVEDLDILDGSPVLDLKPYVPYVDAIPDAATGWLEGEGARPSEDATTENVHMHLSPVHDPAPAYEVVWSPEADEQARWVRDASGLDLRAAADQVLALGPQPHPYRRIRKTDGGLCLAVKEWRVHFVVEGPVVRVGRVASGYRPKEIASGAAPEAHRGFDARFS